ncbi:hypothetical protein VTO73DRAFT_1288 [Trametes versicolor]
MRSPALAFSLFAVAATVSAQSNITQRSTLEQPEVHVNVGSYQMQTPKEFLSGVYPRAGDRGDERHEATRGRRPEPPHVNANHGVPMGSSSGNGIDGGVSDTAPAIGANAGDGSSGSSSSSSDSGPASGSDIFNIGNNLQNAFGAKQVSQSPDSAQDALSAQQADAGYKPTAGYTYNYQRMKRMSRVEPAANVSRRDVIDSLTGNENDGQSSSDDNSNHDGADGTSQRGSETNGGHAGEVGSSEGGHVYNEPSSSE